MRKERRIIEAKEKLMTKEKTELENYQKFTDSIGKDLRRSCHLLRPLRGHF